MAHSYPPDWGTRLKFTLDTDVSAAESVELLVYEPDGTEVEYDAEVLTGTSGKTVFYDWDDGEFEKPGTYRVQVRVTFETGCWLSTPGEFVVRPRFA